MTETIQQRVNRAVQERLRIANETLMRKNGVDPTSPTYQQKKANLIYAWEHGIDYTDAAKHKRGQYNKPESPIPTIKEVEKMLGRKLRNARPEYRTGAGYAVRDVLTGKVYDSVSELAKEIEIYWTTVQKRIERKEVINNSYYEYA